MFKYKRINLPANVDSLGNVYIPSKRLKKKKKTCIWSREFYSEIVQALDFKRVLQMI